MDDVGFTIRGNRLHALDLLETEILPNQPFVPERIHRARGLLHLGHRLLLPNEDCTGSTHHNFCHFRRPDHLCVSNQVRLHVLDAVSLWWSVDSDHFRLHGGILPL